METSDPLRDVELLVRSRHGLVVVDTVEEERATTLLRHLADRMTMSLFVWSRTKGLRLADQENAIYGTTDPAQALAHMYSSNLEAIYHLQGFGSLLDDEAHVERLQNVVQRFTTRDSIVVLTGSLTLPEALRRFASTVRLPSPTTSDYEKLLEHILRDLARRMPVRMQMTPEEGRRLLMHLRGLTLMEAEKVLTKAIVEDNMLSADDVAHVIEAKKQIVEQEGVLEYYPVEESMAQVADLAGLKAWLAKRKHIITDQQRASEFGLTFPKGVLLVGVPGCGKSLCAKAVATEWGLPLLKLDSAALYNKYIGETEKNFKRAMDIAERMSPVILWIDELEKAFASGSEDGGVSQRVLGTFLSWMQDRKGDVFIVATANDVSRLPAEFLRKGRFDEIFFVDLPDADARRAIFDIHLRKRSQDPARLPVDQLVQAAEQFSGAEIEQVIVSALYTAFAEKKELDGALVLKEIAATRPLAHTMSERVTALREWARERTVAAN